MYILVRTEDNKIVATAAKPISKTELDARGWKAIQIKEQDFSHQMIGSTLKENID